MGLSTWTLVLGIPPTAMHTLGGTVCHQVATTYIAPAAENSTSMETQREDFRRMGRKRNVLSGRLTRAQDEILSSVEGHVVDVRRGMLRREALENRLGMTLNCLTLTSNYMLSYPFSVARYNPTSRIGFTSLPKATTHQTSLLLTEYLLELVQETYLLPRFPTLKQSGLLEKLNTCISYMLTYPLNPYTHTTLFPSLILHILRQTLQSYFQTRLTPPTPTHPDTIHLDKPTQSWMSDAMYYGDDAKEVVLQLRRTVLRRYWRSAVGRIGAGLLTSLCCWPVEVFLGFVGWRRGIVSLVGECVVGWGVLECAWWVTWGAGKWLERVN
ncbi:uncharacterized protein SPPG_07523 [Spizellomyces punctatus DAOM BR117]|uniref:Uncharacterized protein n=1 Tax=Spizellomyces punctatus (strain DAOM BR117) TaxID=645134 RepID=A0A0L0H6M2_SPIPD|nr:uncharacterized protein SPPG_07523 [Spizellomyces punctatus DAOM BR117]KNC97130.1 hypothetical protein SPPG_07523 [Spizellomyces punctatus DAOM BR117]|eukprot:XP_016605170.1 hypothetical protein SPPG_07523 [Spizellomyces punctatus DAOM BR117]